MDQRKFEVSASAWIKAPSADVYALLADYHVGHPSILPSKYFASLKVEAGGVGAGTVILVQMDVMGNKSSLRLTVTEPEPGSVLQEEDAAAGVVTQFRFVPANGGTELTIHSSFDRKPRFKGWVESLLAPGITRKIYRAELALIQQKFA